MKKLLLILAMITIVCTIIIIIVSTGNEGIVNIEKVGRYTVNTAEIRKRFDVKEGTPFTFFLQVKEVEWKKEYYLKEFNLDLSCVDFDKYSYPDKYLVLSIGRELMEIKYKYIGEPYGFRKVAKANVTFSEAYHDETLYIYKMDKIRILNSVVGGNAFYIMEGAQKRYLGECIFDLNDREASTGGSGL